MSTLCQIWLPCMCWQHRVPIRYIKIEFNAGFFRWYMPMIDFKSALWAGGDIKSSSKSPKQARFWEIHLSLAFSDSRRFYHELQSMNVKENPSNKRRALLILFIFSFKKDCSVISGCEKVTGGVISWMFLSMPLCHLCFHLKVGFIESWDSCDPKTRKLGVHFWNAPKMHPFGIEYR